MNLFVVARTGSIEQVRVQPIGWKDWFLSLFLLTLQSRIDGDGEKRPRQLLVRFRILGARKEENIFPRVEHLRIRSILVHSLVTQHSWQNIVPDVGILRVRSSRPGVCAFR